jgi:hypothetical protein
MEWGGVAPQGLRNTFRYLPPRVQGHPKAALVAGGFWEASISLILPGWEWASHSTVGRSGSLLVGRTERYYFKEKNEISIIA